jgi:hypothetical protein
MPVTYHRDDEDLIPVPTRHVAVLSKDTEHTIHTGGEVSLDVAESTAHEAHLEPVRKTHEDIKWNGTIVVSPLQEDHTDVAESDSNESTELETVSSDRSTRVKIRLGEEEEHHEPREEFPTETQAPPRSIPDFAERLNHAHVLNAEDEAVHSATIIEEETIHTDEHANAPSNSHAWTYTMAGFVVATCFIFAATNIFVEQVIYVDSVQGSHDLIRSMSRWYGIVSIQSIGDGTASIISSIRDMAYLKGE